MEEDMDLEGAGEAEFLSLEVDFDYEFNAPMFFDFSTPESDDDVRAAERWLCSATSYPPSPFLAALNMGNGVCNEGVNHLPIFQGGTINSDNGHLDDEHAPDFSKLGCRPGVTVNSQTPQDAPRNDRMPVRKGCIRKCSSLMKPTASHLAKQTRPADSTKGNKGIHGLQKPMVIQNVKSLTDSSDNMMQAPKRQKVDGGHFCKNLGTVQQADLVHKAMQKKTEPSINNSHIPRLKITIPREPVLRTAQRAQRLRSKDNKDLQEGPEQTASIFNAIFKARPLNRKILEPPLFPFPQQRMPKISRHQNPNNHNASYDAQGGASSSSTSHHTTANSQLQMDDKKLEDCRKDKFKALPLDKKVLSSKGNIGIFRSIKRETTQPAEFKLSSSRSEQNPPVDLFSKLSLNSKVQHSTSAHSKAPKPSLCSIKGKKENMINPLQSTTYLQEEEFQVHGENHWQSKKGVFSGMRPEENKFSLGVH